MNKSTVWPQAKKSSRPLIDQRPLAVFRGSVVSVADRVTSATVIGPNGNTNINSVPEVWISDSHGKELRFCDVTIDNCRVGHDLVIVFDRTTNRVLSMRNLTTGRTYFAPVTKNHHTENDQIISTGIIGFILLTATWIFTIGHFGELGTRETLWEKHGPNLFYGAAIYLSWWLPHKWRVKGTARNEALHARIHQELEKELR